MASSQRKKSLYLVIGLMILLLLGLLWYDGTLFQNSRGIDGGAGRMGADTQAIQTGPVVVTKKLTGPSAGEADAADEKRPVGTQKELPAQPSPTPESGPAPARLPPSPKSEPLPSPASVPTKIEPEKAEEAKAPETATPVAVVPPASEVSQKMPEKQLEKPIETKPAGPPPPAILAVSAPPQAPEPKRPVVKKEKIASEFYPYSILLCSHRIHANALAIQPEFERKGLAPYIVYTDLGEKGKWWRTLLGSYKNYKEALRALNELKLDDDIVAVKTPFANLLGNYPSEKEAAGAGAPLAAKGLFPYVARGAGNASRRLLVGAFPTQAQAQQQQRELEGMGIITRVIQR